MASCWCWKRLIANQVSNAISKYLKTMESRAHRLCQQWKKHDSVRWKRRQKIILNLFSEKSCISSISWRFVLFAFGSSNSHCSVDCLRNKYLHFLLTLPGLYDLWCSFPQSGSSSVNSVLYLLAQSTVTKLVDDNIYWRNDLMKVRSCSTLWQINLFWLTRRLITNKEKNE